MYLEVYVDVIFLINFLMDYLLLFIVKKVLRYPSTKFRLFLGAVTGGLSACIMAVLQNINGILQFLLAYILISYLMIAITFGHQNIRARVKGIVLLYITTFFLGGAFNSLYYYTKLGFYFSEIINGRFTTINIFHNRSLLYILLTVAFLILSVLVFVAALRKLRSSQVELYEVELKFRGRSNKIVGFLDTGNNLYDPVFKKPVMIVELSAIAPLLYNNQMNQIIEVHKSFDSNFELEKENYFEGVEAKIDTTEEKEEPINIMLVPFRSVGKKHGMLPTILLDEVYIVNGEEKIILKRVLTAISADILDGQRKYQAILHKDFM